MSSGPKGVLDQRDPAKTGVATVTHTAPADLFEGEALAGSILKAKPLGGRAGRPNRRTAEMAGFIQRRIGDPLLEMARLAMCDPLELAREMNRMQRELDIELMEEAASGQWKYERPAPFSIREAMEFRNECRAAILPYVHAKRAAEDDKGEAIKPEIRISLGGLDPAALKIAPGGIDAGSFLDLAAVATEAQDRYRVPSEGANSVESSDGEARNDE
ncbi:MAG: hypothetical protein ACK52I_16680 [Pseudomonadota bacterium]|jgi:hypothetical protein